MLSSKRQVTIPIRVCRELGLRPGDEVEFSARNGRAVLSRPKRGPTEMEGIRAAIRAWERESGRSILVEYEAWRESERNRARRRP